MMHYLLPALLTVLLTTQAAVLTDGILAASDTTGTNATVRSVTVSANTNLNAGVLNATNDIRLNGVSIFPTGTAGTVIGSGTTVANDIAVFTDTTHTNIARSSSAGRFGDNSSATYTLTTDLSGTDVTETFSSGLLTLGGRLTISGVANDTTALTVSGGSVTGSGTTKAEVHTATANTSGNIDGVWTFALTDTASGASTFHTKWLGGASGTTVLMSLNKNGMLIVPTLSSSGGIGTSSGDFGLYAGSALSARMNSGQFSISGIFALGANPSVPDVWLYREAAATLQLGADAASPVAQKLKAHDGSGTDIAGANLTIAGGQSTGTGRGGAVIIQTSPSGSTGSSANSYSERAHYAAKAVTLTETTATTVATVAVASGNFVGGNVVITVFATDATDHQSRTLTVPFSAINKAGTVTAGLGTPLESVAVSAGTLTATLTAVANGNAVDIKVDATSSLTQTTLNATVAFTALNSNGTAAVTEI